MTDQHDDHITDITAEQAKVEHEEGSMHCCTPGRWALVERHFNLTEHPWLEGHLGRLSVGDGLKLVCIDTTGLDERQVAYVLVSFYDASEAEPGVMMLDGEAPQAKAMIDAKRAADMRRNLRKDQQ